MSMSNSGTLTTTLISDKKNTYMYVRHTVHDIHVYITAQRKKNLSSKGTTHNTIDYTMKRFGKNKREYQMKQDKYIHSSKIRSIAKKGGRGAYAWGAPGDELNVPPMDKEDPCYESEEVRHTHVYACSHKNNISKNRRITTFSSLERRKTPTPREERGFDRNDRETA